MKIPQTIEMQVGALNTSEHNPRQITEDDFAELVKSLLLLPKGLYYRPVVVDDRNIALAGNMRLRALKYIHELGFDDLADILRASYRFRHFDEAKQSALLNYWREWQMHPTVPTLYASELDEDEQQQFIIKDNLSFGTFDIDMLANEYDIAAIIDDGIRHAARLFQFRPDADPCNRAGRRLYRRRKSDEIQRRNTADAQGHEFVYLLRRPTVPVRRTHQRRREYIRLTGVAGGGISVHPTNRPRPTRNAKQQWRHDGIVLGRGHICKEFLHGHVLPVMRGCFGNGNRPSAAASSHQMAIRRAEDIARIG